jgi:uncharacterized membrane protein
LCHIPKLKISQRLRNDEDPSSPTTDEAATELASHDITAVSLPAAAADHADADTVKGNGVTGAWTKDEDAKLTSALANTSKKKYGKENKPNWVAVAALVPGRTENQCYDRWRKVLDPGIDRANGHTGTWAEDEDTKLKDAVQTHGDKNWGAIAALVPGRTSSQCRKRWRDALNPSIDRANGRTGRWAEDEDIKLKDAVQTHGDKNWGAIAMLLQGRTRMQCKRRCRDVLNPSIDRSNGRTGKWAEDEDIKLKDAVQTHGDKNWGAIAMLLQGRTKKQCNRRWRDVLNPSISHTSMRTGKWAAVEYSELKYAVQTHGGRNWGVIAELVPG